MMKSGLRAAFFSGLLAWLGLMQPLAHAQRASIPGWPSVGVHADDAQLARSATWAALLHHDGQTFTVPDASFLLTAPNPSLHQELMATLRLFDRDGQSGVCRFPARYLWLKTQLPLPEWSLAACPELTEFNQRAPMTQVSLVFASERLSAPASMMGHLFLKIEGDDAQGHHRAHAISFYTDADTLNLPKLLIDSLVVGKAGHFALTPYDESVRRYVDEEGRNLWEYALELTSSQRALIQAHLIELRHSEFTYYFQKHNCATVMRFIIALARPELTAPPTSWDSPHSVLRRVGSAGLLGDVRTIAPPSWQMRTLAELVPASRRGRLASLSPQDCRGALSPPATNEDLLALNWQLAWTQWQESRAPDNPQRQQWRPCHDALQAIWQTSTEHLEIVSDARLSPLNAPPEAQLGLGLQRRSHRWFAQLDVLPLSHRLEDDHRQSGLESAQAMMATSWLHPMHSATWGLDRFDMYDMTSLLPRDAQLGGWSTAVHIGWQPVIGTDLQTHHTWLTDFGLGETWRIHKDIDAYVLANAGTQWRDGLHGVARPELGLIVREVGDMKSTVQATRTWHPLGLPDWGPLQLRASQSLFLSRDWSLLIQFGLDRGHGNIDRMSGVTLKALL